MILDGGLRGDVGGGRGSEWRNRRGGTGEGEEERDSGGQNGDEGGTEGGSELGGRGGLQGSEWGNCREEGAPIVRWEGDHRGGCDPGVTKRDWGGCV